MPFQLDTRIYGGGGDSSGGGQPSRPLGMLGDLMDFRARQENYASLRDQRQEAIDKAQEEKRVRATLAGILAKDPNAPVEQMLAAGIPHDVANKVESDRLGNHKTKLETIGSELAAIGSLPEDQQSQGWYDAQDRLVNSGVLTQDEMSDYSPANLKYQTARTMTGLQQVQAQLNDRQLKVSEAEQARLAAVAPADLQQKKAAALVAARAEAVPRLMATTTLEEYTAEYGKTDAQVRSSLPTPADYAKNPIVVMQRLKTAGLTPEQLAQDVSSAANRTLQLRMHNETEQRLRESGLTLTGAQIQAAKKAYDLRVTQLEERIADADRLGKPFSPNQIRKMQIQTEQGYNNELGLKPSTQLAEEYMQAELDDLKDEIADRNTQKTDRRTGKPLPLTNPMTKKELETRQLQIVNRQRRANGLPALDTLPPDWGRVKDEAGNTTTTTTPAPAGGMPRIGAANPFAPNYGQLGAQVAPAPPGPPPAGPPLGALVNPAPPGPPPVAAGPVPPPPGPAVAPGPPPPNTAAVAELARLEDEARRITTMMQAPGPKDVGALRQRYLTVRARAQQLKSQAAR